MWGITESDGRMSGSHEALGSGRRARESYRRPGLESPRRQPTHRRSWSVAAWPGGIHQRRNRRWTW